MERVPRSQRRCSQDFSALLVIRIRAARGGYAPHPGLVPVEAGLMTNSKLSLHFAPHPGLAPVGAGLKYKIRMGRNLLPPAQGRDGELSKWRVR